ncbi:MAG: hypothetical protein JO353_10195, partial [Phycisphaerae bacterium]|nr:hypothetical protein [Phycisphaerae bacterium]
MTDAQTRTRRTYAVANVCAVMVAIVAAAVFAGWIFHIEMLKRIAPGLVAMNPLTALCCLMASVSLMLQHHDPSPRRHRAVALVLSLVIIAAGLSRIIAIWGHLDIGADIWMFRASLEGNRMAPQTASGLIIIGMALALLDLEIGRVRPAQVLGLCGGGLAGVALVGYLYSTHALYGLKAYIPIALHTAICFTLLSLGILTVRPNRGFMQVINSPNLGGILSRRVFPMAIIAPIILGWLRLYAQHQHLLDAELGTALLVMTIIVIFTAVIWLTARLINDIEEKSRAAQLRYRAVVE